jgi:hypothetical protein
MPVVWRGISDRLRVGGYQHHRDAVAAGIHHAPGRTGPSPAA